MKYEKKYLLIKDATNTESICGTLKIEKDGYLKIKYSISRPYSNVDIYVFFCSKLIFYIKDKFATDNFVIYSPSVLKNISGVSIVFGANNKFFVAGNMDGIDIDSLKNMNRFEKDSKNAIKYVVGSIFEIKYFFNFYDKIKNPLEELFSSADPFDLNLMISEYSSKWVRIHTCYGMEVVGKVYSKLGKLLYIGVGKRVEIVSRQKQGVYETEQGTFLIEFYDVVTGTAVKI